jgi:phospholipid-binding lipoprotein MlaA
MSFQLSAALLSLSMPVQLEERLIADVFGHRPAISLETIANAPLSPVRPSSVASSPAPSATVPEDDTQPKPDEIVVTQAHFSPGDPLQRVNEQSYEVVQAVDAALVAPIALAYKQALPGPMRSGVRNVLSNLKEPVYFFNYLLQMKPGKAIETLARFSLNSTLGLAGLFDVAKRKPFKLPLRVNGFANTLGFYGVKPGPYFYLPLIGPTTLRDLIGSGIDQMVLPLAVGKPFDRPAYAIPVFFLRSIDERAEAERELAMRRASGSPYGTARDTYLRQREAELELLRHPDQQRKNASPAPNAEPQTAPHP